ncbi:MAG: hypothetical protein P4L67_05055 [Candidatus Pacebacteria bacterium]|nr:hypothetical protein [Candidatus Paceibacterota bacterium]
MTQIDRLAERTIANMPTISRDAQSKPGSVVVTVAIIVAILKIAILLFECWKSSTALDKCRNPNFIQRFMLRRIVKKVLKAEDCGDQVEETYQSILALGRAMTLEELQQAVCEVAADSGVHEMAGRYGL